ncbi:MAG: hypothetical protein LC768_16470 [Acidobacteria bacterium]|nr:hypothetical protein [Acidobacteriota bacterium]MCA1639894.1 hypothetical protein [Acidobacteriota bacterium]
MKKTTRRTEIQIENHEITIIRTASGATFVYCEQCARRVAAFTPEQVSAFLRMTLTDVCGFIENAKFHLVGKERGVALVCSGSLNSEDSNHDLLSSESRL